MPEASTNLESSSSVIFSNMAKQQNTNPNFKIPLIIRKRTPKSLPKSQSTIAPLVKDTPNGSHINNVSKVPHISNNPKAPSSNDGSKRLFHHNTFGLKIGSVFSLQNKKCYLNDELFSKNSDEVINVLNDVTASKIFSSSEANSEANINNAIPVVSNISERESSGVNCCARCVVAHDHYMGSNIGDCKCDQYTESKTRETATVQVVMMPQEQQQQVLQEKMTENQKRKQLLKHELHHQQQQELLQNQQSSGNILYHIQSHEADSLQSSLLQESSNPNLIQNNSTDLNQKRKVSQGTSYSTGNFSHLQKISQPANNLKEKSWIVKRGPGFKQLDMCTRCTIIHSRKPSMIKRKRNFRIFSDTPINRWTSVPSKMKEVYLKRLLKNSENTQCNKSVEDAISKMSDKQERTSLFQIEESKSSTVKNSLKNISGNLDLGSGSPLSPVLVSDVLSRAVTIVTKSITSNSLPNAGNVSNICNSAVVKVQVGNNDDIGPYVSKAAAKKNLNICLKYKSNVNVNNQPRNQISPSLEVSSSLGNPSNLKKNLRKIKIGNGIDCEEFELTPRQEYKQSDFEKMRMVHWVYESKKGIVESVVECSPLINEGGSTKSIHVPTRDVISSLQLAVRKESNLNGVLTERLKRAKKKQRLQYNAIRKLRYKIRSLEKEMNAPKPYEKFLNDDQIEAMDQEKSRGHRWKDETIRVAHGIRIACTSRGYRHLYKTLKWPLPSIKTIQTRAKELNLPSPHLLRKVVMKKSGEAYLIPKPGDDSEDDDDDDDNNDDDDKYYNKNMMKNNPMEVVVEPVEISVPENGATTINLDLTKLLFDSEPKKEVVCAKKKKAVKKAIRNTNSKVPKKKMKMDPKRDPEVQPSFQATQYFNSSQLTYIDSQNNTYLVDNEFQPLENAPVVQVTEFNPLGSGAPVQNSNCQSTYVDLEDQIQKLLNSNSSFSAYSGT